MEEKNIRNFSIIAHIDHGKSTLADRMLEVTGTVEKRKMKEQVLDSMELERERGITIKMAPVRMIYHPDRRNTQKETQNDAEFLYKDLTYKIRGILFDIRKKLGLGHKENVYHNALEIEFQKTGLSFESKKNISIQYDGKSIGTYQPDFIVENKILIELKALPEIGKPQTEQIWSYLKGCDYKLALLVNYGSRDLEIQRVVYDTARKPSALSASSLRDSTGVINQVEGVYTLNLIDTPGHIDFSYEVSRALKAVEGAVLLVDATQGVQAQTLSTLDKAREMGLTIIPVVSKIDSPLARIEDVKEEVALLLGCDARSILGVSGKTGEGVPELFAEIVRRVPSPESSKKEGLQALVFDFRYSDHRGIIVYCRIFNGGVKKGDPLAFSATGEKFAALEVGTLTPLENPVAELRAGETGYIVTGIKKADKAVVGDTIIGVKNPLPALSGYQDPPPVVWASVYPESQDDFDLLKSALLRLKLSDSSLSFSEEKSLILGRGFRCGFLGMLHLEIIMERLKREFELSLVVTSPSIVYEVEYKNGTREDIYSPAQFPEYGTYGKVREPWVLLAIITPERYIGDVMQVLYQHEGIVGESHTFGSARVSIDAEMPLRELMRNFFDELKRVSSGFASFSYIITGMRDADVVRLDVLVAEEVQPAFSQIVPRTRAESDAKRLVERLYDMLPRQLFVLKIQGRALGRILSSKTLSALKKDVTGYLYGGDITRKRKLWEKQKKGKKKLKEQSRVDIPHDVFLKMLRQE